MSILNDPLIMRAHAIEIPACMVNSPSRELLAGLYQYLSDRHSKPVRAQSISLFIDDPVEAIELMDNPTGFLEQLGKDAIEIEAYFFDSTGNRDCLYNQGMALAENYRNRHGYSL